MLSLMDMAEKDLKIRLTSVEYSPICNLFAKHGEYKKIREMEKRMRDIDIVPGLEVYNALIKVSKQVYFHFPNQFTSPLSHI